VMAYHEDCGCRSCLDTGAYLCTEWLHNHTPEKIAAALSETCGDLADAHGFRHFSPTPVSLARP
jgi:hypothetical protein